MYKLCAENEISDARGAKVPLKGGSLIEVIHEDVRDIPMYGAEPPGTGTGKKGMAMANVGEAMQRMNEAIDKLAVAKNE